VDRIWEKLGEPEACLVIGHFAANREVVAMALAEPGRAEHGSGAVIPGYGHLSMVFVHPDLWDKVSAACCCKDFTSVHRKEAGGARRRGPGRRTCALDAFTKAADIEGQVVRRPSAAVIPSSSSSVKHSDPRRFGRSVSGHRLAIGIARLSRRCRAVPRVNDALISSAKS
jgi:hypothetical protein